MKSHLLIVVLPLLFVCSFTPNEKNIYTSVTANTHVCSFTTESANNYWMAMEYGPFSPKPGFLNDGIYIVTKIRKRCNPIGYEELKLSFETPNGHPQVLGIDEPTELITISDEEGKLIYKGSWKVDQQTNTSAINIKLTKCSAKRLPDYFKTANYSFDLYRPRITNVDALIVISGSDYTAEYLIELKELPCHDE